MLKCSGVKDVVQVQGVNVPNHRKAAPEGTQAAFYQLEKSLLYGTHRLEMDSWQGSIYEKNILRVARHDLYIHRT